MNPMLLRLAAVTAAALAVAAYKDRNKSQSVDSSKTDSSSKVRLKTRITPFGTFTTYVNDDSTN